MTRGNRKPDTLWGELPDGIEPGDYWKITNYDLGSAFPGNLTRMVWQFYSPDGNGIGTLISHTVREEEDGTISVRPGDGSSNSILHSGGSQGKTWHGYVEHGVWTEC
jgi:hypothetical protein